MENSCVIAKLAIARSTGSRTQTCDTKLSMEGVLHGTGEETFVKDVAEEFAEGFDKKK